MKFSISQYFVLFALLFATCSNPMPKNDKAMLQGHWLTTNPGSIPNMYVDDKHYFMLLQEDSPKDRDSFPFLYELKNDTLTILQGTYEISTNKILSLTNDSLVYMRFGDSTIFHFSKRK